MKHEMKHASQMRKYGAVGFYLKYGFQFLKEYLKWRTFYKAYYFNKFEIEARKAEWK